MTVPPTRFVERPFTERLLAVAAVAAFTVDDLSSF